MERRPLKFRPAMINPVPKKISLHVFVLVVLSVGIWCYLFRPFLSASTSLQGDAFPYLGHIRFYVENIMNGVYPLWDPLRENGNVNEFFLRRIGEFNPFFWFIAILNKIGFSFVVAHRLFCGGYYFLGVAGFYLLSRSLFRDQRVALASTLILLFSSLGNKAFESFILLEIVPAIWFAYFLLAFTQTPRFLFLLGATFCLMIINITYVPFYFYTAFLIFVVCFLVVYAPHVKEIYRRILGFVVSNKLLSVICAGLWMVTLVPGFFWYQTSRLGESLSMLRHVGSSDVNTATVGLDKVNEGGILTYLILDRQFVHLDKVGLSDFYVPVFLFLVVLTAIWSRFNRRLILLFMFGFIMFLIGLADASAVHGFLYHHLPFFRYFRNPQFFLWLVVLPVLVLFSMEQMRVFLQDCKERTYDRRWMTLWVIVVHVSAVVFSLSVATVSCMVYAVIILSLIWILGQIWDKFPGHVGLWILWAAVILQPVEVFNHFASAYRSEPMHDYSFRYYYALPSSERISALLRTTNANDLKKRVQKGGQPYFSVRGYYEAAENLDDDILNQYIEIPFIAYDGVEQMSGEDVDYKRVERSMADFHNTAFVHSDRVPIATANASSKAWLISQSDEELKVLKFNANRMVVRTAFTQPKFLVRTANYHSRWKVSIDGKPAELFRTHVLAQGLWVPSGEHVVEWRFEDQWRYALAYFFVALYLGLLGFLIWLWVFSKKSF